MVSVAKYTGSRLVLSYSMRNETTGVICAEGETTSCFMNDKGRLISLKKDFPGLHILFVNLAGNQEQE